MKKQITLIALLISLFLFASTVNAQITVNSDITTNTTWGISDSPVTVSTTITVTAGNTLTINPGVTVNMGSGASLLIDGALVSAGTDTDGILFTATGTTPGDWGTVEFRNGSEAGSTVDYTTFEYGAGADRSGMIFFTTNAFPVTINNSVFRNSAEHGINLRASSTAISNSEFYNNAGFGVFADLSLNFSITSSQIYDNTDGGVRVPINSQAVIDATSIENNGTGILIENSGRPTITNSTITGNNVGIQIEEVGSSKPTISDNTISGNTTWGIESLGGTTLDARYNFWGSPLGPTVASNPTGNGDAITSNIDYTPWRDGSGMNLPVTTVADNITSSTTWESGNVYHVTTDIAVNSGITLTVEGGTIVKFASGVSMTVNGSLISNGTAGALVTFTSDRDDAAGGDSNGDEDATVPGPGNWDLIRLSGSGSDLSYTVVRYGRSGFGDGVLDIRTSVAMSNVFVNNNIGNGVYSEANQTGWTNVQSVNNSRYGIYFFEAALTMTGGSTLLNGDIGIRFFPPRNATRVINLDDFTSSENGSHGLIVETSGNRNKTYIEQLTNSNFSDNSGDGVRAQFTDIGTQLYENNTFSTNSGHGLRIHHGVATEDVIVRNNSFSGNGQSGLLANSTRVIDNDFENNRFGVGTWYNMSLIYTDDSDVDSNTFSENTYGGVALYAINLSGTISATVPEAFTHPTYVLASTGDAGSASAVVTIDPGVTIKASPSITNNGTSLLFDGQLTAMGTADDPITFTSIYDHNSGGNIAPAGNERAPARGDWGGLQLRDNGTRNSTLDHVIIRYGRTNLEIGTSGSGTVDYTNTFQNLEIENAQFTGIIVDEALATFDKITVSNSGNDGVLARDRSNNGVATIVDINNSTIENNGGSNGSFAGLHASNIRDGATFGSVTGSVIEENANGVIIERATRVTLISQNQIRNNVFHGVSLISTRERQDVSLFGNTFLNNGQSGVRSSKAIFIDNTFEGNRFGIAAWNRLGHIYVDENGVDGNQFINNTYNNSIALYASNLEDTLSASKPESFDFPSYILASSGRAINSGDSLKVEPGVTIKTAPELVNSGTTFQVDGQLIAEGTSDNPIVFTSLYDHENGGNIAQVDDDNTPSKGNWGGLHLNNAGSFESRLSHVYIRYARINLEMGTSGGSEVNYVSTFDNMRIENASRWGILFEEASAEFNSLTVTDNNWDGVFIRDRSNNGFSTRAIIRDSFIERNGGTNSNYAGLHAGDIREGASFTEVTNTVVSNNSNGIVITNSGLPTSIQFNQVRDNVRNGIFARMVGIETDEALEVGGNTISGHTTGTGLISTRALIEDNTFENNNIPIAVMGKISKDETAYENGNLYNGNIFAGHTYADAIGIYSTGTVSLDGNLGFSWPASFSNPAYVPISGTIYINAGDSVTVAPGTVIKLGRNNDNDSFNVSGSLVAKGEIDSKIIFTSLDDDTYAGDTNQNSTDTVPARGDWDRILLDGASSSFSEFEHVIARYGTYNFYFDRNSEVTVASSFSSNATYGFYSEDGAKPTVRNSDIHSNQYGFRVLNDSDDPNLQLNNFYNNDTAALWAFRDMTAINNYWGDSTGPFVADNSNTDPNLGGQGDEIRVNGDFRVEYEPWQVSRSGVLLGDVSEDGSISAFDGSLVLQFVVEEIDLSDTQQTAADVNGNGTVNAFDASNILQYVVGAISGFPGAGKRPAFTPEEIFEMDMQVSDAYFDLIIKSKGALPIYSGQVKLTYDESRFTSTELITTAETTGWSNRVRAENDTVAAALAGIEPSANPGDLIHLRFHFDDAFKGSPGEFKITELIFNEIDLTEAANQVTTSTQEELFIPDAFSLEQNYPNPFNPTTNIQYQLPESAQVTVSVFNSIGQQVAVLANRESKPAGVYSINWNAGSEASGVYFYRIEVAGESGATFTDVRKMTLIK